MCTQTRTHIFPDTLINADMLSKDSPSNRPRLQTNYIVAIYQASQIKCTQSSGAGGVFCFLFRFHFTFLCPNWSLAAADGVESVSTELCVFLFSCNVLLWTTLLLFLWTGLWWSSIFTLSLIAVKRYNQPIYACYSDCYVIVCCWCQIAASNKEAALY